MSKKALKADRLSRKSTMTRQQRSYQLLSLMTQSDTRANNHGNQPWYLDRHPAPRSYNIRTAGGTTLRRNRRHLKKTNEDPPDMTTIMDDPFTTDDSAPTNNNQMPPVINVEPPSIRAAAAPLNEKRTRSGRVVRPPARYPDD